MILVSTLSHSPATMDGGSGLAEMVCTPVLPKSYLLMEPRYTSLRQKTVDMGLVAGRYQETRAHLPRSKCTNVSGCKLELPIDSSSIGKHL
jgi:hypothetical protein